MPGVRKGETNEEKPKHETRYITASNSSISHNTLTIESDQDMKATTETAEPALQDKRISAQVYSKDKENKLDVKYGENEKFNECSSAKSTGFRPPPLNSSAQGSVSASSRKNFRETWSSIAPSLTVMSPAEIHDQVQAEVNCSFKNNVVVS